MIKVIKKIDKEEFKDFIFKIDERDPELYKVLKDSTIGIFQFSGNTAENVGRKVNPENFNDLVAVNAFARPGTIDFLPQYLENKENDTSTYPEKVNEILKKSHNTIIFQEQVMSIFNKIGGFTLEETNYVRSLLKKLGKADKKPEDLKKWDAVIAKFEKGASDNGLSLLEAKKLADDMVAMSSYSFNLSHAVAYSFNGLMTMYLALYFKEYFYSAIVEYEMDKNRDTVPNILKQIKKSGFKIIPPSINSSKVKTYSKNNTIYIGLRNLKQIGDVPAQKIIENAPYNSFEDFLVKNINNSCINKRAISSLVEFGCFDTLEKLNRKQMVRAFETFWESKKIVKNKEEIQEKIKSGIPLEQLMQENESLLEYIENWRKKRDSFSENMFITVEQEYLKELELNSLGFNFFVSPFSEKEKATFLEGGRRGVMKTSFDEFTIKGVTWRIPVFISSVRIHTDKNKNEMAFVTVEDLDGQEASIPIFASFWKFVGDLISPNSVAIMSLYKNEKDQIMFGMNKWIDDGNKIKGFVMPVRR
jgi:DNA polymerase III alpha subunit